MEALDDDLDFAFQLQLKEAMAYSLLEDHVESKVANSDPYTVQLSLKFEQERKDAEATEAEMNRIRDNLKIQSHDQKFAQEIVRIPDDEWEDYGYHVHKPFAETSSGSGINDAEPFRLYFKGLFTKERVHDGDGDGSKMVMMAAIGAAVCDSRDNLILNIQKPLVGDWDGELKTNDLQFKVEAKALSEGLDTALSLGIKHIDVFCDYYPLFHHITMKWQNSEKKVGTAVDHVAPMRKEFARCSPNFVARTDVKFAFKLARDAMDTQVTRFAESSRMGSLKEKCNICLEDCSSAEMFAINDCLHRYCQSCIKQHVEVKLHHGIVPKCPYEKCETQLDVPVCQKFLSPDLTNLMNRLIKESSVPLTDKVYCPNPTCSMLMSKAEILGYIEAGRSAIQCIKCDGVFCINCQVPWHNNMSCAEYSKRNPNIAASDAKLKRLATKRSWRQCTKCKNMIELAEGCYHITCRCGYEFCYTCGAEWRNKRATCTCPIWDERNIMNTRQRCTIQ